MGNEKANSYWEAELPPNYDRVGIENFIRAKYVWSLKLDLPFNILMHYSCISNVYRYLEVKKYSAFRKFYRYEDKRWVAKEGKPKSPSRVQEEKPSLHGQRPAERSGSGYSGRSENLFEDRKRVQTQSVKESIPASRVSLPVPPRGPEQVCWLFFPVY